MTRLMLSAVVLVMSGCSVQELKSSLASPTENVCSADDECGTGRCIDGSCRAREGRFTTVLFGVTPPADAPQLDYAGQKLSIAGVHFLKRVDGLPSAGGNLNLALDHVARVTGSVVSAQSSTCNYAAIFGNQSGSVPVTIVLSPTQRLPGHPVPSHELITQRQSDGEYRFDAWVPPGDYDIYVKPSDAATQDMLEAGQDCRRVPQLFRKQSILAGDVALTLTLPPPSSIQVIVPWDSVQQNLSGWVLDVIEPVTGRLISNQPVLEKQIWSLPILYTARVAYSPVAEETAAAPGSELVRLSPPNGVVAPTLLMQRNALLLSNPSIGEVLLDGLPPVVTLDGRVIAADNPSQVVAGTSLTLIAKRITGLPDGMLASFQRNVDSDTEGAFTVDVVPGEYRIFAVPPAGSGLAATQTTLDIAANSTTQAGKVIELGQSSLLTGRVLTPSGNRPITGASVHAVASSASTQITEFEATFGQSSFVPRASIGCESALCNVVGEEGRFSIETDPGSFDVSIRPASDTGFAWLIWPSAVVDEPVEDLGTMKLRSPVAYGGTVSAPGSGVPIAGALIRAYIYMAPRDDGALDYTTDPSAAVSVVQIAETRADAHGTFELFLPSDLK